MTYADGDYICNFIYIDLIIHKLCILQTTIKKKKITVEHYYNKNNAFR